MPTVALRPWGLLQGLSVCVTCAHGRPADVLAMGGQGDQASCLVGRGWGSPEASKPALAGLDDAGCTARAQPGIPVEVEEAYFKSCPLLPQGTLHVCDLRLPGVSMGENRCPEIPPGLAPTASRAGLHSSGSDLGGGLRD